MIQVRPYRDGDLDAINNAIESGVLDSHCREIENQGLFLTLELNESPFAVGGLVMTDEDTAEAWAKVDMDIMSNSGLKLRVELVRAFSDALDMIGECLDFPVIYSVVKDGFIKGDRLARVLGFKQIEETITKDGKLYHYYKRAS